MIFCRGERALVESFSFLVITTSGNAMGILRAIGLGLVIIVLRFLVPSVWNGLEHLVIKALSLGSSLVDHLQAAVGALPIPFAP
jgi:hypothetical protein